MLNKVLWTIDNELNGATFERLAVDLLYRNGYKDIVPIEPQDSGRDAEEFPRAGRGRAGEACFFQFSLEEDWRGKLRRDARKLQQGGFDFTHFVYVTSQKARGVDVDKLRKELRHQYKWELEVYSREWLRLQLEEAHPDLAKKYLGIDVPDWSRHLKNLVVFKRPTEERLLAGWEAFNAGQYERAAAELKQFLEEQPESVSAWEALAWSQYQCFRYDEALASINRANRLTTSGAYTLSIRACILTEKGIREHNKASLLEGRDLFESLLNSTEEPSWPLLYNFANALSALGDHEEAIKYYNQALQLEDRETTILKNLASAYHMMGDHESEMRCINKVLELDPDKPEGLATKGVSLLIDFNEAEEAAALLERAMKTDEDWAVRWPYIWYWLALAHYEDGQFSRALNWIEDGLAHQPGFVALKKLKADVLTKLIAVEPAFTDEARRFWLKRLQEEKLDYDARAQLISLELQEENTARAWKLLEGCFEILEIAPVVPLRTAGYSIEECVLALKFLPQYKYFRDLYPVADYWNTNDPLYDLPFLPPESAKIEAALLTYLAIPFGLGLGALEEMGQDRESERNLREFFEKTRPCLEKAIVESARFLAPSIPNKTNGIKRTTEKFTDALLFLGLIALREFGRQRGWIPAQFRVPVDAVNDACVGYDENLIHVNVITKSLITLNQEVGLLPEGD